MNLTMNNHVMLSCDEAKSLLVNRSDIEVFDFLSGWRPVSLQCEAVVYKDGTGHVALEKFRVYRVKPWYKTFIV